MKKITIIVGVVSLMSSCGIQFGNYERYRQLNRPSMCKTQEIEKSIIELRYYVNEDVYNGNLSEEVYEFYTKELYKIEQSIKKIKCENCDEIG